MLVYLQTLLAAFALLKQGETAPTPHHTWLPLSEWGDSGPSLSSWDYLGLGNAYPLQHRVDSHESWLPQPASPTFEIVRTFRKPAVDPSSWAQIPVLSGGRDFGRQWVALVPRGFEDFVLVRKPFVIVEESDEPAKNNKKGSKEEKEGSKEKDEDSPKDKKDKDDKKPDNRTDGTEKSPEPTSSTSTTAGSTTPTTMSTSTTPSTTTSADDEDNEDNATMTNDSQPQQTKNRPQK